MQSAPSPINELIVSAPFGEHNLMSSLSEPLQSALRASLSVFPNFPGRFLVPVPAVFEFVKRDPMSTCSLPDFLTHAVIGILLRVEMSAIVLDSIECRVRPVDKKCLHCESVPVLNTMRA